MLDVQLAAEILLRRQIRVGEGCDAVDGDVLIKLRDGRIAVGLAERRGDVPVPGQVVGHRRLRREVGGAELGLVSRRGGGDNASRRCGGVEVEAVQRAPSLEAPSERHLEVAEDPPGILRPQPSGARLSKPFGVELACAGRRRAVPDGRGVHRVLEMVAVAVDAEADLLRTILAEGAPYHFRVGILPVRPIVACHPAVLREGRARANGVGVELGVLQVVVG